jgi:hypothetical protein
MAVQARPAMWAPAASVEAPVPEPHVRAATMKSDVAGAENPMSVGFVLRFGKFDFVDLGDLRASGSSRHRFVGRGTAEAPCERRSSNKTSMTAAGIHANGAQFLEAW